MQALKEQIIDCLNSVPDPEIPVISVVELGIIRNIFMDEGKIEIIISPTYNGCPALDVIPELIREALVKEGINDVVVKNNIDEAWSTDWISQKGKKALNIYGIAPPEQRKPGQDFVPIEDRTIFCPQCKSSNTSMTSKFGSTPCKALFKCEDCLEPFDYFKCH